jgi:(p)ppGpp synthase/HD superfamily hydrolase
MTTENKASFFARLEPRLAPSELVKVRAAYYLAKYGHRAQVRKETDGQGNLLRYFEHVRRVAIILMDEADCYDPDLICTALLHDALEDTEDKEGYADRLRLADDETLLVKACDRLDNLRSLGETPPAFRKKQFLETLETYWPLFRGLKSSVTDKIFDILTQARKTGELSFHLSALDIEG